MHQDASVIVTYGLAARQYLMRLNQARAVGDRRRMFLMPGGLHGLFVLANSVTSPNGLSLATWLARFANDDPACNRAPCARTARDPLISW